MNGFRQWMADIMRGRYGMDDLNRFLLYLSLILIVINIFLSWRLLHLLIVILLIILYARMFSRSIYNRQKENMKYLQIRAGFTGKGSAKGRKAKTENEFKTGKNRDSRRVLICPYCKEKLRVPVGAGNIKIKCPHCGNEFEEVV